MSEMKGHTEVRMGSNRSFGIVFAVVFAVIGLFPLWTDQAPRSWSLVVALAFFAVALLRPPLLNPLNRLWFRVGMLLSRLVSPLIMGILFFITVVPTGLVMRTLKKDLLKQSFDPEADSYWIDRSKDDHSVSSMRNQF